MFIGAGKRSAVSERELGVTDYEAYVNTNQAFMVRRSGFGTIEWTFPENNFIEEPYSPQRWREIITLLTQEKEDDNG
jgi:hypothetical protein